MVDVTQDVKIVFSETASDQSEVKKAMIKTLEPLGFRLLGDGALGEDMLFGRNLCAEP